MLASSSGNTIWGKDSTKARGKLIWGYDQFVQRENSWKNESINLVKGQSDLGVELQVEKKGEQG